MVLAAHGFRGSAFPSLHRVAAARVRIAHRHATVNRRRIALVGESAAMPRRGPTGARSRVSFGPHATKTDQLDAGHLSSAFPPYRGRVSRVVEDQHVRSRRECSTKPLPILSRNKDRAGGLATTTIQPSRVSTNSDARAGRTVRSSRRRASSPGSGGSFGTECAIDSPTRGIRRIGFGSVRWWVIRCGRRRQETDLAAATALMALTDRTQVKRPRDG